MSVMFHTISTHERVVKRKGWILLTALVYSFTALTVKLVITILIQKDVLKIEHEDQRDLVKSFGIVLIGSPTLANALQTFLPDPMAAALIALLIKYNSSIKDRRITGVNSRSVFHSH